MTSEKGLERGISKGIAFVINNLFGDNDTLEDMKDLAFLFKAPMALSNNGYIIQSHNILDFIKASFMTNDGDFLSNAQVRSMNAAYVEYSCYINGWIVMAAHKLGRYDLSYPGYQFIQKYYHPALGGCCTNAPFEIREENVIDMLSTAHMGMVYLLLGNSKLSNAAGQCLLAFLSKNKPFGGDKILLRMKDDGKLITEFSKDMNMFYVVEANGDDQAFFMIGYPIAFLGKLYMATKDETFLKGAEDLFTFALTCGDAMFNSMMSHKVAWSAAVLYGITKNIMYRDACEKITVTLLKQQGENGSFLPLADQMTQLDQSAEICNWLTEIKSELRS